MPLYLVYTPVPPTDHSWNHLVKIKASMCLASQLAQTVKNLPAMQETWLPSLGWEDPLEKGMATHSSILTWEIPWTEKPVGLQSMGSQNSDMT